MTSIAKAYAKSQQEMSELDKRRRKSSEETRTSESPKQILLPQKKRVLPPSATGSPVKKSQKLQDESVADENLIRETEAALKNLSGSWPGPRGSSFNKQEESPAFENLFDEKKATIKMSPSSNSSNSMDTSCNLKDVITLRDPQNDDGDLKFKGVKGIKIKQEEDVDYAPKSKKVESSQYECDFNELVDDSSNELEIDMSETGSEKNDDERDSRSKRRDVDKKYEESQPVYHPFPRPVATSASPFSTTSAFRPPQQTKAMSSLGPYPAEATFVGYPGSQLSEDKAKLKAQEEQPPPPPSGPPKSSVASPESVSKQYTILQPAAVGSRAASALQEVARDGVAAVSAISSSSSSSSESNGKAASIHGSLSPNSLSRGE